jgi:uncharacterized protein
MSPRIVLFARFPEPGRAKTRLIPAIGPERAAALHRTLTERTLAVIRESGLPYVLRTTGAPPEAFTAWLEDEAILDQGEGGLGERLARAGPPYPTLFIGADAPDLTPALLKEAAAALEGNDAVIGPAEDGGYWLLGLGRAVPGVFEGIDWSTERVFAQTCDRLRGAGVEPAILPMLADCDRPEDLARWPDLLA